MTFSKKILFVILVLIIITSYYAFNQIVHINFYHVSIKSKKFSKSTLIVRPLDVVTFHNNDNIRHVIVTQPHVNNSQLILPHKKWAFQLPYTASIRFYKISSSLYPQMKKLTIVVRPIITNYSMHTTELSTAIWKRQSKLWKAL